MPKGKPVESRHLVFALHYLQCWNPSLAALKAGYKNTPNLHTNASKLLQNAEIQAIVQERIKKIAMDTDEVLARLATMARGDLSSFLTDDGGIDFTTEQAKANIYLLKKARVRTGVTKSGEPWEEREVELHDPQAALVHIGRHLKLFTDRVEIDDEKFQKYHVALDNFLAKQNQTEPEGGSQ